MKNNIWPAAMAIGAILVSTGCAATTPRTDINSPMVTAAPNAGRVTRGTIDNNTGNTLTTPTNTPNTATNRVTRSMTNNGATNGINRAKEISRHLSGMEQFQSATVAINGNTALVGIKSSNRAEMDQDALKEEAIKKVKSVDPAITNVIVTMAPDMYQRIQNLSTDIANGKAIEGLGNEFTEIGKRIMPKAK